MNIGKYQVITEVDVYKTIGIFGSVERCAEKMLEVYQFPLKGPKAYVNLRGEALEVTWHIKYTWSYRLLNSLIKRING